MTTIVLLANLCNFQVKSVLLQIRLITGSRPFPNHAHLAVLHALSVCKFASQDAVQHMVWLSDYSQCRLQMVFITVLGRKPQTT